MTLVKEMVRIIGGLPLILTPERQDDLVAMTSHLPYLLASALMMTTLGKEDEQLWSVAASGFQRYFQIGRERSDDDDGYPPYQS